MKVESYVKLAASVREMLPAKGMSKVAEMMGVQYNTVRGWFTGVQGYDTQKTLDAIETSLDLIEKDAHQKLAFVAKLNKKLGRKQKEATSP